MTKPSIPHSYFWHAFGINKRQERNNTGGLMKTLLIALLTLASLSVLAVETETQCPMNFNGKGKTAPSTEQTSPTVDRPVPSVESV